MAEAEVSYCDNYEEITGKKRPDVEAKVVAPPEAKKPAASDVKVETK